MFTNLAQANLDHYNNHPTSHLLITAAYGIVATGLICKMAEKVAKSMTPSFVNY